MADIYGQRIQSTVNTEYLPFLVDQVLTSNVVAQRVIRAAKKFEFTGRKCAKQSSLMMKLGTLRSVA